MTFIIAGGLTTAAAALLRLVWRRIVSADHVVRQGIRHHVDPVSCWPGTVSASDSGVFFTEGTGYSYKARHAADDNDMTVDLDDTHIVTPSTGKHSVDNPNRSVVPTDVEEIRWSDGARTLRPLWLPIIGHLRIAILTTDTGAYAIHRVPRETLDKLPTVPISPFTGLTRPYVTQRAIGSGKIPDSYYAFTTT